MAKKAVALKKPATILNPAANIYANQLNNAQASAYAAMQQQQSHTHSVYSNTTAITVVPFGKIGSTEYRNGEIKNIEIFGAKIAEEDFNKINSSNALLLQFDGETFKVDGKEIYIEDISSLGEMLIAIFARRNLLNE